MLLRCITKKYRQLVYQRALFLYLGCSEHVNWSKSKDKLFSQSQYFQYILCIRGNTFYCVCKTLRNVYTSHQQERVHRNGHHLNALWELLRWDTCEANNYSNHIQEHMHLYPWRLNCNVDTQHCFSIYGQIHHSFSPIYPNEASIPMKWTKIFSVLLK